MGVKSYADLIAWQKAMDLVEAIYLMSARFPREELYVTTSQIRRAAISIPSNIAEGQGRWNTGEFIHFLGIAHGSLCELETQTLIAARLKFVPQADTEPVLCGAAEVGRLIHGLRKSLS
jgi:four helix bundle protein